MKMTAENFREIRLKLRLTQAELAEKLFCSTQTISNYECGSGIPKTTQILMRQWACLEGSDEKTSDA